MCRSEFKNSWWDWYKQNFCSEGARSTWQMFSETSRGPQNFHGLKTWSLKNSDSKVLNRVLVLWTSQYWKCQLCHSFKVAWCETRSEKKGSGINSLDSGLELWKWGSSALILGRMDSFDEICVVFHSGSVSVTDLHFWKLSALHVSLVIWYLWASPKAKAIKGHLKINKSCQKGTVSDGEWGIPIKNEQNVQSCLAYFWEACARLSWWL